MHIDQQFEQNPGAGDNSRPGDVRHSRPPAKAPVVRRVNPDAAVVRESRRPHHKHAVDRASVQRDWLDPDRASGDRLTGDGRARPALIRRRDRVDLKALAAQTPVGRANRRSAGDGRCESAAAGRDCAVRPTLEAGQVAGDVGHATQPTSAGGVLLAVVREVPGGHLRHDRAQVVPARDVVNGRLSPPGRVLVDAELILLPAVAGQRVVMPDVDVRELR